MVKSIQPDPADIEVPQARVVPSGESRRPELPLDCYGLARVVLVPPATCRGACGTVEICHQTTFFHGFCRDKVARVRAILALDETPVGGQTDDPRRGSCPRSGSLESLHPSPVQPELA